MKNDTRDPDGLVEGWIKEGQNEPRKIHVATDHPGVPYDALTSQTAERLLKQKLKPVDAVPTFLRAWSKACRDEGGGVGVARGWMDTMAAPSGKGKSIFGGNQAVRAVEGGVSTAIHSAEMSQGQNFTRLMAMASRRPVHPLEQGRYLDAEAHRQAARIFDQLAERTGGRLLTNRKQLHNLGQLVDAVTRTTEVEGCTFHVVDYFQLYAVDPNDPAAITQVAHRIRQLAQDLNVAILALSQFNRSTSASPDRPTIHGLMGSSAIENDSDQVLLIDHSRMERAPAPEQGWFGFVLLDKNRHGPLVEIPIHFDTTTLRIRQRGLDEEPAMAA